MNKPPHSLTHLPSNATYEVGHRKPPVATRFKPGQSGNPKGRPKGSRSRIPALHEERLKEIILAEAYRHIKVNDGARQVNVPMAQAIIRSMAVAAAKGNPRSQRLFAELLATTENANRQLQREWLDVATTYKVEWERELERRKRFNIIAPDPIPHPDDIVINFYGKGLPVEVRGPMSKEELAKLQWLLDRREEFEAELADIKSSLKDPEYVNDLKQVEADIDHTSRCLSIINQAISYRAGEACLKRMADKPQRQLDPP